MESRVFGKHLTKIFRTRSCKRVWHGKIAFFARKTRFCNLGPHLRASPNTSSTPLENTKTCPQNLVEFFRNSKFHVDLKKRPYENDLLLPGKKEKLCNLDGIQCFWGSMLLHPCYFGRCFCIGLPLIRDLGCLAF